MAIQFLFKLLQKMMFVTFIDLLIIRELHADARASASEIARKTNANERTIRKRIERLVSEGAIRLTAILEPEAFGYGTAADIFLEADADMEAVILDRLMAMPEVTYVALGQETKEISIAARFRDNEALREFLGHTLPGIPGITVTGYALVPRILRNIDEWMPKEEDFNIP
jgi:Lrp/AsnC family transcriptional regulator for asnA, asnC and gidA